MAASGPRVLHIAPALFGRDNGVVGGAERYALELARHMAELVPTRLVAFGERAGEQRVGALDVRVIADAWTVRGQSTNRWSASVLREVLRSDVVHCHQTHLLMSSTTAAWCRLTRRRVFATDLGGGGWDISGYVSTDAWFDGHLHISHYSRKVFGHEDHPRAGVIFGGVDTRRFCPDPSVRRDGPPLYAGRLVPHKGVADLIDALPAGMSLDVIGPVADAACYDDLRARAGHKAVRFRHDVDDDGLIQAYRRATCVILPSVYRTRDGRQTAVPELLGQTLLEAMACGAPVVATNVASLPEIVVHGVTGLIVQPGDPRDLADALVWLAGHPAEAADMGANGRRRVLDRFQWSHVVERCLDAYDAASGHA